MAKQQTSDLFMFIFHLITGNNCSTPLSNADAGQSGLVFGGIYAIVLIVIMTVLVIFLRQGFKRLKTERDLPVQKQVFLTNIWKWNGLT